MQRLQRGEMLLGVLFALAIASAALIGYLRFENRKHLIAVASVEGEALSQFAVGLRGFAAAVQANPALLPPAPLTGVEWLKAPGCGGRAGNPPSGHVPCAFQAGTFGSSYQTRFSFDAVTQAIEFRTSFIVPRFDGSPAAGATNQAAIMMAERLVQHTLAGQSNPSNGVFFSAYANVAEAADGPHEMTSGVPAGNSGRVVLVVTNAPSHDIFLRTDGTNRMLANLDMGGMSIANARDGRFSGNVRIDGEMQIRNGLTVTDGPADFREGVLADEILLTSIGKRLTEGFYDAQVLAGANSYTVAKPDCSQAGGNPGIYTALQSTGTPGDNGYSGDALYGARVDVVDQGSSWRISPLVQTTRFNLGRDGDDIVLYKDVATAAANSQRILVMRRCR